MKKYSGLILFCVILGLIGMVTLAWAAVPSALSDFRQSHNVGVAYQNGTTTQTYGMATKHTAGDRVFGTTDSSNIYYKQNDTWKGKALSDTHVGTPTAGWNATKMTSDSWTAL